MSDSVYSMTVYCYLTYLVQVGEGLMLWYAFEDWFFFGGAV